MERIKQALEKARLERQKSGGDYPASYRSSGTASSESIAYTHTRTVPVQTNFLQTRRIIAGREQNSYTEAYKMLRTQVLQRLREKNWNSLAVTSSGVNEGKTLTAINLAISLSMEVEHTVLLVDADLRHPSIHNYFGFEVENGLSDYLTVDKPLSDLLIHPDQIPGLVVLPGGSPMTNSAEMLNSPKMAKLVEELKTRYTSRIILFDLPPLLSAADALAFSPYVDAALLVIEDGKTQTEDAKRAIELLQGTNVIGTVLNKSNFAIRSYGEAPEKKWVDHLQDRAHFLRVILTGLFSRLRRKKQ
ncbi:MAG: CpsD/CapB family tyrosine-protein kinase [Sulfuricaulis sp.]